MAVNGFRSAFAIVARRASSFQGSLTKVTFPEKHIAKVTMTSPKNRNALSLEMLTALTESFQQLAASGSQSRVAILSAEGPVFSSGHNLKELTAQYGKEHHKKVFSACTKLMTLIQDIPIPVIAEVGGLATAAGCQLVASCDMVVAADTVRFATPGVNIGLFCSTPAVAVARSLTRRVALEMAYTGEAISAEKACLHGLVNKVVPEDELSSETMKLARKICSSSAEVISLGKACFYEQIGMNRKQAYALAEDAMVHNLSLPDGQEGLTAFIEKRPPKWN